jgi:hypothetical protein
MINTAWLARGEGKGGVHLDLSQRELTSYLSGEAFVAAGAGLEVGAQGNDQPPFSLQDCFLGADRAWVAITLSESQVTQVQALVGAGKLDEMLSAWVARRPAAQAVEILVAHGIAAAEALGGNAVQARAGEIWDQALQHSPEGSTVKGFPLQFDHLPLAILREAPANAADSLDVLSRVGGFGPAEIEAMVAAGAVEIIETQS